MSELRDRAKSFDHLIKHQDKPLDLSAARDAAKAFVRMNRPLRTERTLRSMAKEFTDVIWDEPYDLFRKGMQTTAEEVLLQKIMTYLAPNDWPEGWKRTYRAIWPNRAIHQQMMWPRFYKVARNAASEMLGREDVSEIMKQRLYDAIIEDRSYS